MQRRAVEVTFLGTDESAMRAKTVVITGGTSGIGEVAAVALAKMGVVPTAQSRPRYSSPQCDIALMAQKQVLSLRRREP